jgi:hypothetical protein
MVLGDRPRILTVVYPLIEKFGERPDLVGRDLLPVLAGSDTGHLTGAPFSASRMPTPDLCRVPGWTYVRTICFRVAALYARNS